MHAKPFPNLKRLFSAIRYDSAIVPQASSLLKMLFLAWRHVLYNRAVSLLLIAGLTLVIAFPVVVSRVASVAEDEYASRARATPLVVGRRANAHQLTLNTLYFEGPQPPPIPQKFVKELRDKRAGRIVPAEEMLAEMRQILAETQGR